MRRQQITPGLLESFAVRPVIGRLFRAGEEAERPALISEGYWRRRFNADPDVLGRKLIMDGRVFSIIGVLPAGFEILESDPGVEMWTTIDLAPGSEWVQRSVPWLLATAKLKHGSSIKRAQAELDRIAANLGKAYPETNRNRGLIVMPMLEARNGRLGATLYPLFGAVAFVLLIACTNVANLLLTRAIARRREISVRAALGAGRKRLMRELLADGIVLAVPGVLVGLAVAYGGIALFRVSAPPGFPGAGKVELNLYVLAFTAAAAALSGILAAFFPALEGSKVDLTEALKDAGRGSAGRKRQRLRSLLVASEIALALILLVGAGLTVSSVYRLQTHETGFDSTNVTIAQLHISGKRYMTDAPQRELDMRYVEPPTVQFFDHVLREVRALPGVSGAALAGNVPMGPTESRGVRVRIVGGTESDIELRNAEFNVITDGFFETLRIPLRRGRYLNESDTAAGAWVAVVNEAFAREFFPDGSAVGKVVNLSAGPEERPREIVGVVADFTQLSPRVTVRPEIFTSYLQQPREIPGNFQGQRFRPKLIVKLRADGAVKQEAVAKIIADFDKDLAIFDMRPHSAHIAIRSSGTRFYARALGLFAAIALALAVIGIYGVMSYSVSDRFHEIGIRSSLGATRGAILWLIVSHGLKLAAIGLTVGIAGALWMTRLLQGMLFGVTPWDPSTFVLVAVVLVIVTVTASAIPAARAMLISPAAALRRE
jgi:putative ABC transport system permease protein